MGTALKVGGLKGVPQERHEEGRTLRLAGCYRGSLKKLKVLPDWREFQGARIFPN